MTDEEEHLSLLQRANQIQEALTPEDDAPEAIQARLDAIDEMLSDFVSETRRLTVQRVLNGSK